jgi:hypothetical protein
MSTEQSIDPHLIEQTKQQIRSLVAEIEQLADSQISPEEVLRRILKPRRFGVGGRGGAVWTTNDEEPLAQYQIDLQRPSSAGRPSAAASRLL